MIIFVQPEKNYYQNYQTLWNWKLPGFLVKSGVLDDVATAVNSASSGSSPVILILPTTYSLISSTYDVNTIPQNP